MVVWCTEQVSTQVRVPGQAVALLLMPPQPQVRTTFSTGVYKLTRVIDTILCIIWWNWFFVWINRKVLTWFGWVFGVVKHQHVRGGGLGGDDAVVLWHVSGSVHFSFMIDLNLNFDLSAYRPKPSKLWKQMPIHIHWQLSLMFFLPYVYLQDCVYL